MKERAQASCSVGYLSDVSRRKAYAVRQSLNAGLVPKCRVEEIKVWPARTSFTALLRSQAMRCLTT
jgi:hypothetical protein